MSLSIEIRDPLAKFVTDKLGWNWQQFFIFAFILYGPIEKLLIPAIGGYLDLGHGVLKWTPHLEAFLDGFIEFPFFLAFYLWMSKSTGDVFVNMLKNKSFADEEDYIKFLRKIQKIFNRWWWLALSLTLTIILILLCHFILWGPESTVPPWFGQDNLPHRVLALTMIGLVGYAISQILIRVFLAIYWLRRLWTELGEDLVIHPYHSDGAGGLGMIGQYTINLSFFMLVVMLFIIVGSMLHDIVVGGKLSISLWSPLIVLLWPLYLIIVPLSVGWLLWPSHRIMLSKRNEQLDVLSMQLDDKLDILKKSKASEDWNSFPKFVDAMEHLKSMRNFIVTEFPTWPINARMRRQLRISTLLPLAHFFINLGVAFLKKSG